MNISKKLLVAAFACLMILSGDSAYGMEQQYRKFILYLPYDISLKIVSQLIALESKKCFRPASGLVACVYVAHKVGKLSQADTIRCVQNILDENGINLKEKTFILRSAFELASDDGDSECYRILCNLVSRDVLLHIVGYAKKQYSSITEISRLARGNYTQMNTTLSGRNYEEFIKILIAAAGDDARSFLEMPDFFDTTPLMCATDDHYEILANVIGGTLTASNKVFEQFMNPKIDRFRILETRHWRENILKRVTKDKVQIILFIQDSKTGENLIHRAVMQKDFSSVKDYLEMLSDSEKIEFILLRNNEGKDAYDLACQQVQDNPDDFGGLLIRDFIKQCLATDYLFQDGEYLELFQLMKI